ncbi:MAG TPA: D-alanine--D-alanine ligase [Firmicutes bacterium]|nr:D-alanine--D-alanine ligase [Candidatus Fermentithermobacillaceae bacterium]
MRVALLCGGRSGEHEISVLSARSVFKALLEGEFDVVSVGITREGHWVFIEDPEGFFEKGCGEVTVDLGPSCYILPDPLRPGIWINGRHIYEPPACSCSQGAYNNTGSGCCRPPELQGNGQGSRADSMPNRPAGDSRQGTRIDVDVVFPVLHGIFGEDGTIQGLLDLSGIPYVGPGTLASAVCMDKDTTKMVFARHGIPYVPSITVERWIWEKQKDRVLEQLTSQIGFPVFVKPSASGSSLGVFKVKDSNGLPGAIDNAFLYDLKVLIEPSQEGAMEIECSVLGNQEPIPSIAGQIIPSREFYDYEAKYMDEATRLIIPAPLDHFLMEKVRAIAVEAFRATGCSGLARVDFFVHPDTGEIYVNELNTMPGFTDVSMYPKLWESSGMPYSRLVKNLIGLALERKRTGVRHVRR